MDKDQYWAQVGARIAAGEKIRMEDAWVAQSQAEFYDRFLNGSGSSSRGGGGGGGGSSADSLGVILLILLGLVIFLFIGCPYFAWNRLGQGHFTSGIIFLGLAVCTYGGAGYWGWYEYNDSRKKKAEAKKQEEEEKEQTKVRILEEFDRQIAKKEERIASEQRKIAKIIHEKREIINQAKTELDALKSQQDEIRQWNDKFGDGKSMEEKLNELKEEIIEKVKQKAMLDKMVNSVHSELDSFFAAIGMVDRLLYEENPVKIKDDLKTLSLVLSVCGNSIKEIRERGGAED